MRNLSGKKKIFPQEQRENAASRPRHGFKKLPEKWTRQKVARAYNDAPLRGIPKSLLLQKCAERYDFPFLSKKRQNGLNFTSTTTKTLTATQETLLINLIKSDTNSVTKIAVFFVYKTF